MKSLIRSYFLSTEKLPPVTHPAGRQHQLSSPIRYLAPTQFTRSPVSNECHLLLGHQYALWLVQEQQLQLGDLLQVEDREFSCS
jgi:hypothetical protein